MLPCPGHSGANTQPLTAGPLLPQAHSCQAVKRSLLGQSREARGAWGWPGVGRHPLLTASWGSTLARAGQDGHQGLLGRDVSGEGHTRLPGQGQGGSVLCLVSGVQARPSWATLGRPLSLSEPQVPPLTWTPASLLLGGTGPVSQAGAGTGLCKLKGTTTCKVQPLAAGSSPQ